MVTGYEVTMYRDIARIASALERIADQLETAFAVPEEEQADQVADVLAKPETTI